ncbi:hypothetical protein ACJMK2_005556 [Sinanodonta woodiana]|uniref:RING-type domain-containing protein n=1 Tax=Sinanodonta woodiana TaxID=1069815 RepID=A0ABD3VQF1_SINWO
MDDSCESSNLTGDSAGTLEGGSGMDTLTAGSELMKYLTSPALLRDSSLIKETKSVKAKRARKRFGNSKSTKNILDSCQPCGKRRRSHVGDLRSDQGLSVNNKEINNIRDDISRVEFDDISEMISDQDNNTVDFLSTRENSEYDDDDDEMTDSQPKLQKLSLTCDETIPITDESNEASYPSTCHDFSTHGIGASFINTEDTNYSATNESCSDVSLLDREDSMDKRSSHCSTPVNYDLANKSCKSTRLKKKKTKEQLIEGNWSVQTLEKLEQSKKMTDRWLKTLAIPDLSDEPVKIPITELNSYLTCGLCLGYLYEASTITECMHVFCKNCIVKHTLTSLHCPICNIEIHPTDPFVNIKFDRMLQDIVYKILPQVAEEEIARQKEFYNNHLDAEPKVINPRIVKVRPSTQKHKNVVPLVSIILENEDEGIDREILDKKYVRVNGSATVANVSKFLKTKLHLQDSTEIDIYCCGDCIEEENWTLQTLRDKFYCGQDCLMLLQYKIRSQD